MRLNIKNLIARLPVPFWLVFYIFLILIVIPTLAYLGSYNKAAPSTPPDSCFNFDSGTGTITDYYNNEGNNYINTACTKEVIIPNTIGGTVVTNIGDDAFYGNNLIGLTIPNSVTTIGNGAFQSNQLVDINIEGNINTAGEYIFQNNPIQSLTYNSVTYTIADSITEDCFSFDGVNTITKFRKADITTIRADHQACLNPNINIPSSINGNAVTIIGLVAFSMLRFNTVIIPNSIESIGEDAFYGSSLTTIVIPNSVTVIEQGAFLGNSHSRYNFARFSNFF